MVLIEEPTNSWACSGVGVDGSPCPEWEEMPADQPRWQMGTAELVELGETDEQYALYKCGTCGTLTWSKVVPRSYRDEE